MKKKIFSFFLPKLKAVLQKREKKGPAGGIKRCRAMIFFSHRQKITPMPTLCHLSGGHMCFHSLTDHIWTHSRGFNVFWGGAQGGDSITPGIRVGATSRDLMHESDLLKHKHLVRRCTILLIEFRSLIVYSR